MLKDYDWRLLIALQHQTGKLGKRMHVWGVGGASPGKDVSDRIRNGKEALVSSKLYRSEKLLAERRNKIAERCCVRPQFEDFAPVNYRQNLV